jgi:hypothetical protein
MKILERMMPILCIALVFPAARASAVTGLDVTFHEIKMSIDPSDHSMTARDRITLQVTETGRYVFLLRKELEVRSIKLNGRKITHKQVEEGNLAMYEHDVDSGIMEQLKGLSVKLARRGENVLEVEYGGVVYDTLKVPEYSRGAIAEKTSGIISEEGVYLEGSAAWYPDIPGDYSFFTVEVTTPRDYKSLTEGKLVSSSTVEREYVSNWEMMYPTRSITLVAGRYTITTEEMDGVTVMVYFFPSEKDLIEDYMKAVERYIKMYNNLIGPYPFSKFAVVENFFPTGFGMPSFTLLGRRVIRLPFIVYTSLGHEVAHNWWGNSVYPDYDKGNWCEGLTVYFADHRYKAAVSDSAAADYRRTLDIDYTSYVHDDNDFPLTEFLERTTPATRAVGYGKCAMVFHMLRGIVGEDTFYRALRSFYENYQFKEASWDDIEGVFEKSSGMNLRYFFDQWVKRKGAPTISLARADVDSSGYGYRVDFLLRQRPVYRLLVPVEIAGEDTLLATSVWLSSPESSYTVETSFKPSEIRIDPHYDLFRRLDHFEIPPTISSVLGDEDAIIVLPTRADDLSAGSYEKLAEQLSRSGEGVVKPDSAVTVADLAGNSLLVLGDRSANILLSMTPVPEGIAIEGDGITVGGITYRDVGNCAYVTFRSPFNPSKTICVVAGLSPEAVDAAGYKIIHYGKYSFVTFHDGRRLEAGVLQPSDNPLVRSFH